MPTAPDTYHLVQYDTPSSRGHEVFLRNISPVLWAGLADPVLQPERITLVSWHHLPDGQEVVTALTKHHADEPPVVVSLDDLLGRCVAILNDQGTAETHAAAQKLLDILIQYGNDTKRDIGRWVRYMTPMRP